MRKTITSLCTLLLLAGCSPQHVKVNSSPDAPVVQKDERSIITDLRQQVMEAEAEDAWLYVPETKECHDIGMETTETEGQSMTVDFDVERIKKIAAQYSSLRFYHIHPLKPLSRIMQPYIQSPPKGYTGQRIKDLLEADNVVPSWIDIGSAIAFSCLFDHHQSKIVHHRVVSQYGVTEYKPDLAELFEFCEFTPEDRLFQYAAVLGRHVAEKFRSGKIEKQIKQSIARQKPVHLFRNSYLTITFHPYDSLKK
ncbi:hypothetical protein HYT55_00725 [Candidatus Woesearchaeota archaeon]|nr:hypothetical protein [Candidatus Woesearchaeota archaeon]